MGRATARPVLPVLRRPQRAQIELAVADDLAGPWTLQEPGALHLRDTPLRPGQACAPRRRRSRETLRGLNSSDLLVGPPGLEPETVGSKSRTSKSGASAAISRLQPVPAWSEKCRSELTEQTRPTLGEALPRRFAVLRPDCSPPPTFHRCDVLAHDVLHFHVPAAGTITSPHCHGSAPDLCGNPCSRPPRTRPPTRSSGREAGGLAGQASGAFGAAPGVTLFTPSEAAHGFPCTTPVS